MSLKRLEKGCIVFNVDNDFEVKVLNPNAEMEKGVDEARGKEFYTLYF